MRIIFVTPLAAGASLIRLFPFVRAWRPQRHLRAESKSRHRSSDRAPSRRRAPFRMRGPCSRPYLGRGKPEEIGNVVASLASDATSFMHGAEIFVDGALKV